MDVSVVMTVYNGEKYLLDSITSILNQSFTNFEFIIVNDGSTDDSRKMLDSIKDKRVKVIHQYPNRGAALGLNRAIQAARGKWIAIQDGDDVSHPDRLKEQFKFVNANPDVVLVSSLIESYQDDSGTIEKQKLKIIDDYWNSLTNKHLINEEILRGCPLCHGSAMFSKKAFTQVGGYDSRYKIAYDWELWLRLWKLGSIEKVRQVLYYYHVHNSSLSRKNWNETCNEMMRISLRYICKYKCNPHKKPSFIVIGSNRECDNFKENVLFNRVQIVDYIYDDEIRSFDYHIQLYKKYKLDGFLILEGLNSPQMIQMLLQRGLILNKDIYRFHTSWNRIE